MWVCALCAKENNSRFRFPNWTPVRFLQYSVNPNVCGHNRKVDEVLGKHGAAFQPKAN